MPCFPAFRTALALLLALAVPGVVAGQPVRTFVDLVDFPVQQANWWRFHTLQDHLAGAFFTDCADQHCEPRHLLWPLQLRCSVRASTGQVAACSWAIAGSNLQVRHAGSIDAEVVIWRCALPIIAPVDVEAFHAALAVEAPLQVRLPGGGETVLGALQRCLAEPGSAS